MLPALTVLPHEGYSLEMAALCGTPARVAKQAIELRDAATHHALGQMSTGYVPHPRIMGSMRASATR